MIPLVAVVMFFAGLLCGLDAPKAEVAQTVLRIVSAVAMVCCALTYLFLS